MYTRTVMVFGGRFMHDLEKIHTTSRRKAKKLGWKPGLTHSKTIGNVRYIFSDGITPVVCLSSREI